MKYDSLGLLFAGMAVIFLAFILFGHKRREHMSNETSKWSSIQKLVEDSLKEKYDFNIMEFRKNTTDQKEFFDKNKYSLTKIQESLGIKLDMPDVKDMKNTNKPFDERYRLIDVDINEMIKMFKNIESEVKERTKERIAYDILLNETSKLTKSSLVTIAKAYMITKATDVKPKTFTSTISKIIG